MIRAVKILFWSFCCLVFAVFLLVFFIPVQDLGIPVDPNFGAMKFSDAQVEYFDIYGADGQALWQQIRQKGPESGEGDAATEWSMRWTYSESTASDGTCTIQDPQVTYSITVVFPRWRDPQRAPYALLQGWQDYLNGIARHEQHHVDIVVENADRVKQAIIQAGCGKAKDAAQQAYEEIVFLQNQYDKETDHGRLEGIFFPDY